MPRCSANSLRNSSHSMTACRLPVRIRSLAASSMLRIIAASGHRRKAHVGSSPAQPHGNSTHLGCRRRSAPSLPLRRLRNERIKPITRLIVVRTRLRPLALLPTTSFAQCSSVRTCRQKGSVSSWVTPQPPDDSVLAVGRVPGVHHTRSLKRGSHPLLRLCASAVRGLFALCSLHLVLRAGQRRGRQAAHLTSALPLQRRAWRD